MTSSNTRLTRLLDRGFYPSELPPPFRTQNFSSVAASFLPPANYSGSTTFFDGATFRGYLRTFGVVNPANYALLSKFIANNWSDFVDVYKLSGCSGARPKFPALGQDGRAIETTTLAVKRKSQRHLASAYPVTLSLDINRFYGSIYTHSIPWAVLGKQEAKRRYRAHTLSGHWSDDLDKLVRNCNQRQTVGIAIGPDTSRVISELVLSRIDEELTSKGSGLVSSQIFHSIDDYQFGCLDESETENAQSKFARTISRYELRLNDFKTAVDSGLSFAPSNFQRNFDLLGRQRGRKFVEHFFETLYSQTAAHPNTNVIGYALKRFARKLALNREKDLVREYLQRLIFAAPHQARWILPLLLGSYKAKGVNSETRRLIGWGIETCARRNDVGSLLWYLYAAIFLGVRVTATLGNQCAGIANELVDLVLYHGRSLSLFSFDIAAMRNRYLSNVLSSPSWLPLYEVERRAWDTTSSFTKLGTSDDEHSLYEHLRTQSVEFYVTDPGLFEVGAFEGWGLTQMQFSMDEETHIFDNDFDIDFAGYDDDDWENYD